MVDTVQNSQMYDNNNQQTDKHDTSKRQQSANTHRTSGIKPATHRDNNVVPGETDAPTQHSWTENLPGLLRKLGAIAVLISLYSFLSKGWAGSNDLAKYFMLLGNTVGLAGVALLIGHFFKEGKSPRLLLALGLVSIPVNFAIVGAFIFYAGSNLVGMHYPSYVAWKIDSLGAALGTAAVAFTVLAPIALLGFRTLARGMSRRMTAYFMLSNALLLIPFRDPLLVAGVAVGLSCIALLISAKTTRQRIEAQTLEGRAALLIQFIPLGILLGRNLWLYAVDEIVIWATSALLFIAIRQASLVSRSSSALRYLFNLASLLPAGTTGFLTSIILLNMHASISLSIFCGVMVASGLIYEISLRGSINRTMFRSVAMAIAVLGSVFDLIIFNTMTTSILLLLTGSAILVFGCFAQQRSLAMTGSAIGLAGLIDQIIRAFSWFDMGSWVVLLIVGVTAIVVASVIETQSGKVKYFLREHRKQLGEWCF